MNSLRRRTARFFRNDDGVTTVEYAIMLMLIIVVAVGAILNAGDTQKALWFDSASQIETVATTTAQL